MTAPSGRDLSELADDATWQSAGGSVATTRQAIREWTAAAGAREDVLLFEVAEDGEPVGQIFLHDIDGDHRESLVGYHLVAERYRGRGTGTEALKLLVGFVREATAIETLVIITAGDNVGSHRVAEKNGFTMTGPPREDPTALCFKLEVGP